MSQIVTTQFGRFRRVSLGLGAHNTAWLWECPGCGQWASLSDDQWSGKVSVDHASDGCVGRYHEVHPFGNELIAVMQARILTGDSPIDPENKSVVEREKSA